MSKHTMEYLHENTRVGFGRRAWWFDAVIEKARKIASHYAEAVPMTEVRRLLGSVQVTDADVYNVFVDREGNRQTVKDDRKIAKVDAATGQAFGYFRPGATHTDYTTELVDNLSAILGSNVAEIGVASCGLLNFGAMAHLSIGTPEEIHDEKSGVKFRNFILAASALDGSLALTYKHVCTLSVCDNTVAAALGENGATHKVKRTKNAGLRIANAREALGILSQGQDEFTAAIRELTETAITDPQVDEFLNLWAPIPADGSKHAVTHAENRRDAWLGLYRTDARCEPWRGTLFGAFQATNTYAQHVAIRRGAGDDGDAAAVRAERNLSDVISGKSQDADAQTLDMLYRALATA